MILTKLRACVLPALLCLFGACSTPPQTVIPSLPANCQAPHVFAAVPGYVPIYADRAPGGAFSEVDPAAVDNMKRVMGQFWKDLNAYLKLSDSAARTGDEAAAQCALGALSVWAQGGHMLTEPTGTQQEQYQSRYEFKWALQGIATAYALVLKPHGDATQRMLIETWLRKGGEKVAAFNIERPGDGKLNNHYYWGGASVMAVAVATGDRHLRELARRTYEAGVNEIRDDGSMPRELTRRQQSLHYHNFSLTPLTMMAELSRLGGEDWYNYRPDRLPRLTSFITHALDHPENDLATFGFAQDRQLMGTCSDEWGWAQFWRERAPETAKFAAPQGRCSSRLLGGDIALLRERGLFAPSSLR
jgi:poly(beta-D-mannuronate) lyase